MLTSQMTLDADEPPVDDDRPSLEVLPDELLEKLMSLCSVAAVLALSQMNRRFLATASLDSVWSLAFHRDFASPTSPAMLADFNELQAQGIYQLPYLFPSHTPEPGAEPIPGAQAATLPSPDEPPRLGLDTNSKLTVVNQQGCSEPPGKAYWRFAYRIRYELEHGFHSIMRILSSPESNDDLIVDTALRLANWHHSHLPISYCSPEIYQRLIHHFKRLDGNTSARLALAKALYRIGDDSQPQASGSASSSSSFHSDVRTNMKRDLIAHIATEVPSWKPLVDTSRLHGDVAVFIIATGLLAWVLGEVCSTQHIVAFWSCVLIFCYGIFDDVFCAGMTIAAAGCFAYHSIVHFSWSVWSPLQLFLGFLPALMLAPERNVSHVSLVLGILLRYPLASWLHQYGDSSGSSWLHNAGFLAELLGVCGLVTLVRPTQVLGQWRSILFISMLFMRAGLVRAAYKHCVRFALTHFPKLSSARNFLSSLLFYISTERSDVFEGPYPDDAAIWPLPIFATLLRITLLKYGFPASPLV